MIGESLNKYFNFEKAYKDLKDHYLSFDFDDLDNEAEKKAVEFFKSERLPLHIEECDIHSGKVWFDFALEFNTANESDNYNEWVSVNIGYDYIKEIIAFYEESSG